jgi:hypothetical protein
MDTHEIMLLSTHTEPNALNICQNKKYTGQKL